MEAGFKRLYRMPKRVLRGASLARLSARGQYLYQRSQERFARRADAYLPACQPLSGEIGCYHAIRFISAPSLD